MVVVYFALACGASVKRSIAINIARCIKGMLSEGSSLNALFVWSAGLQLLTRRHLWSAATSICRSTMVVARRPRRVLLAQARVGHCGFCLMYSNLRATSNYNVIVACSSEVRVHEASVLSGTSGEIQILTG